MGNQRQKDMKEQTAILVLEHSPGSSPISYEVTSFKYMFDKDYDRKGNIVSNVKGGNIGLTLSALPTDALMAWAFDPRKFINGHLLLHDAADGKRKCHLSFEQARCVKCKIKYSLPETRQLGIQLTINAARIILGENGFFSNEAG